ncbi:hypothetical protein [methanotrophic endosymbiont of Bathymodiolus puteoserpentis (Logatchev)]|jgi:hypothetical protein|uniref:hypothetical protein n=1 Tax=methanotrophic endosymbiont of Bathymodiolus puteoserpentis (Logatchev) TaxID=343235 RepID=UPI0013C55560|nr:hypothetical protein [methanotrophic endosymbiont of Bathymodiolus puteoserpentis (Logatchev)]SHE22632.1 hypothetical protein BPUTEOMOX_2337 [methanotrophic endosymbiont of Bathymodiolus puteoserpentis (Logatchev)]
MNEQKQVKSKWNVDAALNHIYINEIMFVAMVFLIFLGEVIIEVFDRPGIFYWLLMTPIFCFFSILSEKTKAQATGKEIKHLYRYQFLYWGSAFIAVLLVFLSWHAEAIKASAAGIVIHIILAHTVFLSGIVLGFRFYLIGFLLFCTAALTILMQTTFGIDLLFAIPILWLGFYWEKTHLFPTLKRKSDFVKEMIEDQEYNRRTEDDK